MISATRLRPLSTAGRDLGLHAQLDDQVDGRCELARREPLGDVRARLHRAGHELADGGHGVGGVRGGDGAGAGLHRLDHRPDLLAADLADDLAGEVEAEGVDERLVEGELARPGARQRPAHPIPAGPPRRGPPCGGRARGGAARTRSRRCRSPRARRSRRRGRGRAWSCPAPCAPATTIELRARTAARRNEAATGVIMSRATRSSSVTCISR